MAERLTPAQQREAREKWRRQMARAPKRPRRPFEELVVQPNGQVRQAGATDADGALVKQVGERAQRCLFTFSFVVLDMWWLYPPLHEPICAWLQRTPPHRKALMVPRGHCKSTLGCQAMPLHMIVQQAETNLYLPGTDGLDTRILLAGETLQRAQDHLGVIGDRAMNNTLLRAMFPKIAWENPKRESRKWNESELIFPRKQQFPDPTVRAIGVGGAVTGSHPPVLIKDDITTKAAANSPTLMQTAISWHQSVRAILAAHGCDPLEYNYLTRWAVGDMGDELAKDPTVEMNEEWRQVTEGGVPIYPVNARGDLTEFGREGAIAKLMKDHGPMYWLLYMNRVGDSNLVDFDEADLREFELRDGQIVFNEDHRDSALSEAMNAPPPGAVPPNNGMGMKLEEYLDWQDQQRASGRLESKRLNYIRGARRFERAVSEVKTR